MTVAVTLARQARTLNRIARGRARTGALRLRPLIFLTDARRAADPVAVIARWPRALARDTVVIFRHYEVSGRERLAAELARLCRARGVLLLIAADPALARAVRADGVHWSEALLKRHACVRRSRPDWIVTVAAHDAAGLRRAAMAGADAALLSPVFATASHEDRTPLGPQRFARLVRAVQLPVYALGGVDAGHAASLTCSGAVGLAAIGAFVRNPARSR